MVGLGRRSTCPLWTMLPFRTSMLSTIDWSKGCMTILGASEISFPLAETILSMRINAQATRTETTSRKTRRMVAHDSAGTAVAMIAAAGLSNTRTAGGSGLRRAGSVSGASGESRSRRGMGSSLRIDVAILLRPQVAIDGAAIEQFPVRTDIDDLAAVKHEGLIAIDQRGEPVRDDHHRAPARHALEIGVDQRLTLRIERRGRLVEDHQPGIDDQRARDGDALALAAGEIGRALLDPRLITLGQTFDELLGACEPGRAHGVLEIEARPPGQDVVLHGAAEEEVLLQHDAEALAQMPQVDLAQIRPVDPHRARIVAVDPHEQAGDRGLTGARAADQAEHRARRDGETDLVERRGLRAFIFEGHIFEADRTLEFRPQALVQRALLGLAVEYPPDLRERHACLLHILQEARK